MSDIRRYQPLWAGRRSLSVGSALNRMSGPGWVHLDLDPRARTQVVANAVALPFLDGTFGFVLASHVLEHIANPFPAVAEAWRVLKLGGHFLIVVPHALGNAYLIPPQHVRPFVPDTFRYFLPETYQEQGHGYGAMECRLVRPWAIADMALTPVEGLDRLARYFPKVVEKLGNHLFGIYQDIYCVLRKV